MKDKYIVFFISKTKKKMINFIEGKLKEKGLNDLVPSYGNILTALYEHGGKLTMKEIVLITGKDKSTITALVNKLSKLGYVEKEKSTEDKRITFVKVTEKGDEIKHNFSEISADVYNTAYKNFTKEEKETLLRLLKKMNNNFN